MGIKCKAAVTDGRGNFAIRAIEVGKPDEDEVLVQIKASGLCHTDVDSLKWGKQLILGHEGAGVVIKQGRSVKHVKEGDHVILNWAIPCKNCRQCRRGNVHLCEQNSPVIAGNTSSNNGHAHLGATKLNVQPITRSFNLGTLSEYTIVKAAAAVPYNTNIPFASASILGCGVMTGFGSVMNAAKVFAGSTVVVLGAGGVGLNVIQAARIAKASIIIAIDINAQRLAFARDFGATDIILADANDTHLLQAAQQVKYLLNGEGADFAFECTARPELGASPLAMIRNAGTAVQVSGIEQEILFDMNLFEWDKKYINPLYGQCNPEKDFEKMLQLYNDGELKLDELVTKTYPLENLDVALDDLHHARNAKGVILF